MALQDRCLVILHIGKGELCEGSVLGGGGGLPPLSQVTDSKTLNSIRYLQIKMQRKIKKMTESLSPVLRRLIVQEVGYPREDKVGMKILLLAILAHTHTPLSLYSIYQY